MGEEGLVGGKLRWGVLGAGRIARDFIANLPASRHGMLAAVASTDGARAQSVVGHDNGAVAYGSYAELLADPDIDAVYIATLHPQHADLIVDSSEAGKHILCEKPLTVTAEQAERAAAAAAAAGVVLVEAMMYRFQPQTESIRSAVAAGSIGIPLHVDVSCAFSTPVDPTDRLFDPRAAGGAILDVGCYAMSFARMVAAWAEGDRAVDPVALSAGGHLSETGVDDWAVASVVFAQGLTANVRAGIRLGDTSQAFICGSEGHLRVVNPWTPGKGGSDDQVILTRVGIDEPYVLPSTPVPLFGAEIDAVWEARARGEALAMSPSDSVATMRALDRWRNALGLQ